MAWQDVTPVLGGAANLKGRVRYRVLKKTGCIVTLPAAVAGELQWKAGTRLKLSVGGGELFGKLKLAEDPAGLPTLQKGKGADTLFVKLGRWSQLPEREVDRIAVEHQVEGRALIITLPAHALNVAPTPAPAPSAPARSPFASGTKVDVTERVTGRNGGGVAPLSGTRTGR